MSTNKPMFGPVVLEIACNILFFYKQYISSHKMCHAKLNHYAVTLIDLDSK